MTFQLHQAFHSGRYPSPLKGLSGCCELLEIASERYRHTFPLSVCPSETPWDEKGVGVKQPRPQTSALQVDPAGLENPRTCAKRMWTVSLPHVQKPSTSGQSFRKGGYSHSWNQVLNHRITTQSRIEVTRGCEFEHLFLIKITSIHRSLHSNMKPSVCFVHNSFTYSSIGITSATVAGVCQRWL